MMSIPNIIFLCVCIALVVPLWASPSTDQEMIEPTMNDLDSFEDYGRHNRQLHYSHTYRNEPYENNRILLKKTADFEEILKPCNRMPATGRGHEYADCVRNRMLLMGRRKRRQTS